MVKKHQEIQDYYGKELSATEDLKTNACCTMVPPPAHIRKVLAEIHEEVQFLMNLKG